MIWSRVQGWSFVDAAHAFSGQFNAVGIVDKPVENGVGIGGIADDLMPAIDGKLRRDHRRFAAVNAPTAYLLSATQDSNPHQPVDLSVQSTKLGGRRLRRVSQTGH